MEKDFIQEYLFFLAIGTIIGLCIQFLIIRYATFSDVILNYHRSNFLLLKLIAKKLGATEEDLQEIDKEFKKLNKND